MKEDKKELGKKYNLNTEKVISVESLSKGFSENQVLKNFSADLYRGENLAILGRSGSGKSVLIKCIIGLMKADRGKITVLGNELTKLTAKELDIMRAKVGFLFQSNALYDSMTVRENILFPLRRHTKNKTKKEINELILEALNNIGLSHTINMMPSELSGGMKKRISLARTLILKPEIILYDEPTTGLDPITGKEISKLILEIQQKYNTSSMIISHDLKNIKIASNRIIVLIDGKCYKEGTYEELENSSDEKIKLFFE
jgi:phospholipid/cholesterol/gamma-HCH transport system ATP-binding protein